MNRFFAISVTIGTYSSRRLTRFRPFWMSEHDRRHSVTAAGTATPTSTQFLVVNVAVLLLITSSLPIGVWIIGLTSYHLPQFYPQAHVLENGILIHVYNMFYILISVYQVHFLVAALNPLIETDPQVCCLSCRLFNGGNVLFDQLFVRQSMRVFVCYQHHYVDV
jgi:hypothetical protein